MGSYPVEGSGQVMPLLKGAALYGAVMGVYSIAFVYLVVEFLPPPMGLLIPIVGLLVAIAFQWPRWFDGGPVPWPRRIVRRLALVASAVPCGAAISFLIVTVFSGYIAWGERIHRESLQRHGKSAEEIAAALAAHHQEPVHFLADGAMATGAPGVIAALVTSAAGGVMFRKRPVRP